MYSVYTQIVNYSSLNNNFLTLRLKNEEKKIVCQKQNDLMKRLFDAVCLLKNKNSLIINLYLELSSSKRKSFQVLF